MRQHTSTFNPGTSVVQNNDVMMKT